MRPNTPLFRSFLKFKWFSSLSLSLSSLSLSLSLTPQIEDISLIYYRRDDNDIKYLDLDASMEEQVADLDLIYDK